MELYGHGTWCTCYTHNKLGYARLARYFDRKWFNFGLNFDGNIAAVFRLEQFRDMIYLTYQIK